MEKDSSSSEAYYKNLVEKLSKENKQFKQKLDLIEKENKKLKLALFELSVRHDNVCAQLEKKPKPFDVDAMLSGEQQVDEEESLANSGSGSASTNIVPDLAMKGDFSSDIITSTQGRRTKTDTRQFYCNHTLKGHAAPIYTVRFSKSGRLIGTGSFDKTVRIWDMQLWQEVQCLTGHKLNISDLSWSNDNSVLLSGSYDHTVKVWDVKEGKIISTHEPARAGFVQSVMFNPSDDNAFFCGTTSKQLVMFDRRESERNKASTFDNDSMVNSIYVYKDGLFVLTGDAHGAIKIWDVRKGACTHTQYLDKESKPISHVHVSRAQSLEEGQYLGVNSYDNVLRVFDRGTIFPTNNNHSRNKLQLIHSFTGHKSKNLPIKSSFFLGKNYNPLRSSKDDSDQRDQKGDKDGERGVHSAFLIATGSADNYCYVFNIGRNKSTHFVHSSHASPEDDLFMQKLEGHKDRVYGVDFHPNEPILATCSADSTVKVWQTRPY